MKRFLCLLTLIAVTSSAASASAEEDYNKPILIADVVSGAGMLLAVGVAASLEHPRPDEVVTSLAMGTVAAGAYLPRRRRSFIWSMTGAARPSPACFIRVAAPTTGYYIGRAMGGDRGALLGVVATIGIGPALDWFVFARRSDDDSPAMPLLRFGGQF